MACGRSRHAEGGACSEGAWLERKEGHRAGPAKEEAWLAVVGAATLDRRRGLNVKAGPARKGCGLWRIGV